MPLPPADYLDYRNQSRSFESMAAAELWSPSLTGVDRAEQLRGLHVSASLFDVLGVKPAIGRAFTAADDTPGAPNAVVLSHRIWTRNFGGDSAVLGRSILLNGVPHTVIGVMPEGFHFPPFWANRAEIYATPAYRAALTNDRRMSTLRVFARLKPGVSLEQAQAEVRTIAGRLAAEYPRTHAGASASLTALDEISTGDVRTALFVLLAAVAATLLIACANLANLMLARAAGRTKEVAVRMALGAERSHLVRQFLSESLLLSVAGGALGLLLAMWAVPLLLASVPETGGIQLPRQEEIGVGAVVVVFNFVVCLVTGVLFGLAPALQASRCDLNPVLKDSGRGTTSSASSGRLRNVLITAEVAMALVLLAGSGLLIRTFQNLRSMDAGFQSQNTVAVSLALAGSSRAGADARSRLYRELVESFRQMPGVRSASAVNHPPMLGDIWSSPVSPEGRVAPTLAQTQSAIYRVALPDYFQTMGIALLSGRDFTEADNEQAPLIAVINSTMANRFWPGEDVIGKRFKAGDAQSSEPWLTVVGVVRDLKQWGWTAATRDEFFVPYLQDANYLHSASAMWSMTLVLRSDRDATALAPMIQQQIWSVDRNIAIPSIVGMDSVVADALWTQRSAMSLLTAMAALALLLATLGIYAVMTYAVRGRTQEIGVRIALGAQSTDVARMILAQGLRPVTTGVGLGLAGAFALTRLLGNLLHGVAPVDPLVFGGVTVLVAAVALCAGLLPAWHASRTDPLVALRNE